MLKSRVPVSSVESKILLCRGQKVILDSDLATIYGVTTKRLNEQVKRNRERFPNDFCFQLSINEWNKILDGKSGRGTSRLRSQIATASRRNIRFLPYVFTEHGAIMAANVLKSAYATQMSIFVVRAFVRMRTLLGGHKELAGRLAQLEKELKKRLDVHETVIVDILQRIMDLIDPPTPPEPKRKRIGF